MEEDLKLIGRILRARMYVLDINIDELSESTGISRPTVINILKGRNYTIRNFFIIVEALGLEVPKPFIQETKC